MKKTTLIVLGAAALLTLSACSSGADAEAEFLEQVRGELETTATDAELVGLAEDACQTLKDGGSMMDLAGIAMTSGMDVNDASWILGVGVAHFCPDQEDKLG